MNRKMVFNTLGRMLLVEAALLVLPLIVTFIYNEPAGTTAFLITIAIAVAAGLPLVLFIRTKNSTIYAKEGFATVALTWLALSLVGAVPLLLGGAFDSYIDSFFEVVSGLTTTGASTMTAEQIDALTLSAKGVMFWRSFTHWIGGMGVLVFIMAIIPNVSDRSIHLMKAEMPGPVVGKLLPRVKDTAKILYLIYIALTLIETIMLLFGGMDLFESLLHAFGTAGTGGFGLHGDSIASYNAYSQWVITVFMLLFGVNFNLYYLILIRNFKTVLKSTELGVYISIIAVSVTSLTISITRFSEQAMSVGEGIRHSAFQTAAFITTTGYTTADFTAWPNFAQSLLFVLMFLGGCAGSTAGGLKLSRAIILFKMIKRELKQLLHPRAVSSVKFEGKTVSEQVQKSIGVYFALYVVIMMASFVVISIFDDRSVITNFTASVSCFNNVGPAFGDAAAGYSFYSPVSKIVLSFAMLLGRLEIYPLLLAFSPSTWFKK